MHLFIWQAVFFVVKKIVLSIRRKIMLLNQLRIKEPEINVHELVWYMKHYVKLGGLHHKGPWGLSCEFYDETTNTQTSSPSIIYRWCYKISDFLVFCLYPQLFGRHCLKGSQSWEYSSISNVWVAEWTLTGYKTSSGILMPVATILWLLQNVSCHLFYD